MRLKHFLSVFLTLLTLSVGQMWGDTKADIMCAKGFGNYTTGSFSSAGTDYSSKANLTDATGVTYAMQVFNGNTGAVRGNQSSASSNYSCRNTTTKEGYYISSVTLKITGSGTYSLDGGTNNRSVVYFGSSAYANPNTSAPSGTATVSDQNASGQTTLSWTNTDEDVSHFILYNLKTSGTCLCSNSTYSLTVVWTQKTPSGCTGTQLGTPNVTATPSSGQVQLTWPNVTGATKYQVSWNGGAYADATSPYTKNSLSNGTTYTWAVKAIGDGSNYCDSDPTEGSTKAGTAYAITWKVNGETYKTTYVSNGDHLVLPTNPDVCKTGTEFVGWSATSIGGTPSSTKPTFVSSQTTISSAQTYHAVFATKTANSYSLGDVNDLIPGQKVLIVNKNNYALSNSNNSGKLTAKSVSPSSSKIITTTDASIIWTVENDGTKYKFKNTYYLYAYQTNTNTSLYCDDDDSKYPDSWTVTSASSPYYYLYSDRSTSSKKLEYYTANSAPKNFFTTYTSNTNDYFKHSFYVPTYSGYFTSCCTSLGSINGSFKCTSYTASAREFSWANETTASDVDHYELSYKQKNAQGDPTLIANNITNSTHAYTHTANLTEGTTYTYYLKAVGASGHCDATEEEDVLIPYATSTVTFNDNGKTSGSVPDAITQNTGTTVTVPGNTGNLAKDNYAFGGWNTKDDGTGTNYTANATFTLSNDITLYAKWNCAKKVTLTKGTPSNGSFNLSEADGDKYTCDADVVVTVSDITPSAGYRLVGITQTGMESGVTIDQENKTVTYAQYANGASEINVEFEQIPVHTITWSVNGETSTTNVTDGNALVLPDIEPTSCDPTNYGTFVGWYTVAAGSDSEPSNAVSGTKAVASHIPTGDETYYAVWANGVAAGDFALVTDASELNVGDVVTIASVAGNSQSGKVIKAYNSGNNWPSTDVTTSATGKIAASTTDMQTFTLAEGTVEETWAFYDGTGYIYAANTASGSSAKNYMKQQETLDAKGSFTVAIAENTYEATVISQGEVYGRNTMRYNPNTNTQGDPLFSCYSSGQEDIYLYKQESGATAFISTCCTKHSITLDNEIENGSVAATETSACEGTSVTLTATGTENVGRFKTWDVTGMTLTNEQKATNSLTISMPDNDITVSATFDALYAISKVEEGGTITLGANYAAENDVVTISAVAKQDYEEPRVLKVYKTGDESTEITITAGAFTMPGYPVTAKVTYTASKTPLDPPTMGDNSNLTYNSVQLNWTNVANNSGYVLTVKQGEDIVEGYNAKVIYQNATSTVISGLEHLTAYTYTLYAKGDGITYVAVNTAANGGFTTLDYPTVKIYYSENEVMRVAAGEDQKILTDFTLPNTANNGCTQKELVGWTTAANAEYSHDTDAPAGMLLPGAKWQIPTNENCTLYAVYAKVTPEVVSWDETAITDLTASDVFVIVGNNGNNYAMPNDGGAAKPTATSVTVSGTQITSTVAANLQWNLSGNSTDGYTFYPNGSTTTWLYLLNDANDGVRIGSGNDATRKVFTINSGYLYTTMTKDPRYIGIYNSAEWRCYTGIGNQSNIKNQTFAFYKKNVTPAETTNYATQCMAQVAKPSITDVTDGETYEENKTVTITCGTSDATIYYSIDGQDPATEYTEPFTLSDNGEYTIRAYATKTGMIDSDEADEVIVTIDKPFTTIASFIKAKPTNKKLAFTAESNAVVMGRTNSRIYIQDPTGGIYLYVQAGHGKTWAKEKKVVGTITGTYELNNNTPRMVVTDFGETVAKADGTIPDAVVIDGAIDADNFAVNRNKLVTVSGLNFQSESVADGGTINITRGSETYNIYNAFNALTSHVLPLSTTACSVTGILGYYNNKYQLMPIDANCIVTNASAVLPTLSVSGSTDSENPTAVAENKEITITPATGMTSTLKVGTADATDLTGATVVTIDVDKAIKVTAAREYYANAEATYYYHADPSLTERAISKAAMTNGSVTVKNGDDIVEEAVNGATITLLVAPNTNYHMTAISVTDADAGNVSLTEVTAGEEYTFTMPAKAVTVSASFAEDDYATINFVKGTETATGSAPASIAKAYVGKQVTMPVNTFALAAHDFAGWKHGDNTYAEGAQYTVTAADHEASPITFTAQWTPWPIWATTYTSNIIKSGVNTPDASVIPEDHEAYDAWKIAKGSSISLTIPAGTTTIYGHVAAWNKESADVTISGACFSSSRVLSPAADGGIHDGSPFTLDEAGSTYYFKLTPDVAITEDVNITFTTATNKRAVVFGVNAIFPEITLDPASYNFGNVRANQTKSQEFTITANDNVTGTLSATLLNNASGKFSVGAIEDNKVTVTFDPDGATSGDFSAQLKISASNAQVTADLTATAISAEAPEIIVDKNAVAFGQVDPNASVSEAIAVELLHIDGAVSATLGGDDDDKFVLSTTSLTADGDIVITPNTTENGIFSATLTLSATGAEDVVIPLSITVANKWAVTYTSNVTNLSSDENKKVKVGTDNTEYNLVKANKGSSATFKVPRGTQKIHVHMVAWSGEGQNVTISGPGCFTSSKVETITDNENLSGTSWSPLELEEAEAISYYYELTPDVIPSAETTITITAASGKRFAIFGVNQEGGIVEISDDTNASTLEDNANIEVKNGATLTMDADKQIGNLIVEAGGTVSGSGALNVNDLTIKTSLGTISGTDGNTNGKSGQISGSIEAMGDVYIQIELTQASEASYGWYAFSVPFRVDAMNGVYYGDTKLTNEVGYAIMAFHEDKYAAGEYAWKKYRDIMEPGKLYIISVGDTDYKTLRFKKVADAPIIATSNEVELARSDEGDNAGWNGVGNPNLQVSHQDAISIMQFLDHEANSFIARSAAKTDLMVGTAFMIQRPNETSSIEIKIGGNTGDDIIALAPAREPAAIEKTLFEAKLTNTTTGRTEDNLYFTAREDATNTYEAGRDVTKLSMGNAKNTQMTISAYGKQLCAADFPLVNGQAEYPLVINAPKAGNYSISTVANANADIYLTYEGSIIWNLSMGAYEIELAKGATNGYGLLLQAKAPGVATGVEEVQSDKVQCTKVVIDDHVYILRGGQMYDVTGKMVK